MYTLETITPLDALALPNARFVDMRAPVEFEADHVPGAVNAPLFTDEQRTVVGTLFSKAGFLESVMRGEEILHKNLDRLVDKLSAAVGRPLPPKTIDALISKITAVFREGGDVPQDVELVPCKNPQPDSLVVYCWRGGMRSKAVAMLLNELGIKCLQFAGGYRAYRAFIQDELAEKPAPRCFVVRGNTGTGKTAILRMISAVHPEAVLDLEDLARHRSSVLGDIGMKPRTKKFFDTQLYWTAYRSPRPAFLCEGESRKIGDVEIPEKLYASMERGPHILLQAGIERRVRVLVEDYMASGKWTAEEFRERLSFLEKRIGKTHAANLLKLFERGDYGAVAEILITRYYDPLYSHSLKEYKYELVVNGDDPVKAAEEIYGYFLSRTE